MVSPRIIHLLQHLDAVSAGLGEGVVGHAADIPEELPWGEPAEVTLAGILVEVRPPAAVACTVAEEVRGRREPDTALYNEHVCRAGKMRHENHGKHPSISAIATSKNILTGRKSTGFT